MKTPTIIQCTISQLPRPMPEEMFDPMPEVKVRFDNGEQKTLFQFYPDEISFVESEFIGLTEQEAQDLKRRKDINYL